jgi:hypothetical protein
MMQHKHVVAVVAILATLVIAAFCAGHAAGKREGTFDAHWSCTHDGGVK